MSSRGSPRRRSPNRPAARRRRDHGLRKRYPAGTASSPSSQLSARKHLRHHSSIRKRHWSGGVVQRLWASLAMDTPSTDEESSLVVDRTEEIFHEAKTMRAPAHRITAVYLADSPHEGWVIAPLRALPWGADVAPREDSPLTRRSQGLYNVIACVGIGSRGSSGVDLAGVRREALSTTGRSAGPVSPRGGVGWRSSVWSPSWPGSRPGPGGWRRRCVSRAGWNGPGARWARGGRARRGGGWPGSRRRGHGDPEAAYWLGVCEHAEGHTEAALAAWARIPPDSPLSGPGECAGPRRWSVDLGRFAEAERVLERLVERPAPSGRGRRRLLCQLYYWEGRGRRRCAG